MLVNMEQNATGEDLIGVRNNEFLVSIGIPIYNAEKYLDNAIRSVLNQTYTNWELILVDDGSTDSSLEIAKTYTDKRIRIVTDGENKGLIYRLNQLTEMASGEYYARMDNDDIMHFDRIAHQLAFLKSHPKVDVVGSSYFSIDVNNLIIGRRIQNPLPNSVKSILKDGCFAHPTVMGRTSWFRKNQYDKSWERMEDFELWIRTINTSNFINIENPLLFYRNAGLPTLRKYIKSNIGVIKLLQMRRKYDIGFIDSIYYSASYLLKIFVYCLFFCIRRMDVLIKRRSKPIFEFEKQTIEEFLSLSIL